MKIKTEKFTKGILISLATLFLIVVAMVVVGNYSNNRVDAAIAEIPTCSGCGATMFVAASQEKTHNFQCPECLEVSQWYSHMGATHSNGGKCTVCSYVYEDHSREKYGTVTSKTSTHHIITYNCSFDGCSSKTTQEVKHKGASHSNDGKCTEVGCGYQYQSHAKASTPSSYTKTETQHTPVYKCTYSGCTSTYTGTAANHEGGTHENGGKCMVCEQVYQTHTMSTTATSYEKTGTQHTPVYKCTVEGCTTTTKGTAVNHEGATHANGGKCTVCEQVYQAHTMSTTASSYEKTETQHIPVYKCTYTGCTTTTKGTTENHKGGTHENGGECIACEQVYQTHTMSTTASSYEKTETQHIPVYKCTYTGCTTTTKGTVENHKGGTHENGGECIACEQVYQTHTMSTTASSYEKTETQHTPVYKCTYTGCTTTKGTAENHKGGTHENGGECTVCEQVYQAHTMSTTPTSYEKTETQHTPVYKCTYTGCTTTTIGTKENHKGGTHENGGKCTVCEHIYQTHTMSTTPTSYEKTGTQHTPVYKCIYEGCTITTKGTAENHKVEQWTDNTNGTHSGNCQVCTYKVTEEHNYNNGKCSDCNASEPTQECSHAYVTKNDETQHWEECSKCKQVKTGSRVNHTYGKYVDNKDGTHTVTCTKCNYKLTENHDYSNGKCLDCESAEPTQECSHAYVTKNNDTQHWEECSKCNQVKTGSKENHTYGKYVDNKNGTHTATCAKCNYKLTENHTYKDDKCEDCDVAKPSEECEHKYVTKNDDTQHWEECSKCNQVKTGSKENHTYGKYVDNKNGTHTATCTKCNYKLTENHTYKDDKCEDCDVVKPSEECEHAYGKYVDNKDGTHTSTCEKCGYKLIEKHNYKEDKCEKCGSINSKTDNDKNDPTPDNDKKDPTPDNGKNDSTTVDKEIPKAGSKSIPVIFAGILLCGICVISVYKMKKYKNI